MSIREHILEVTDFFRKTRSLKYTSTNFGLSTGTVRKMLVTSGAWSNRTVLEIAQIRRDHPDWDKYQIAKELQISPKTVSLYSPYEEYSDLSQSLHSNDENSDEIVESGECGEDAKWELKKNGLLRISGSGPMMDYDGDCYGICGGPRPKWCRRRDGYNVNKIIVEDGITTLGQYAFSSLMELEEIVLPNTITAIKGGCFAGENHIKSLRIPPMVDFIAWDTFYSNVWLEKVVVPAAVFKIQTYAFHACMSLERLYFEGDAPRIAKSTFDMCHEGKVKIYYRDGAKGFRDGMWNGYKTVMWKER